MPDLPDRDSRERLLARDLYKAWEPFVPRVLKGKEPDWEKFSLATAAAVREWIEDARRVAAVVLFLLFIEESRRGAKELADTLGPSTRPPESGREISGTTRERWAALMSSTGGKPTPADLEHFAEVNFGRDRAEGVAITELTYATTEGEESAREIIENRGLGLIAYWKSEPGACEDCAPLNGKPELVWRAVYPDGPPSPHPRCRCSLSYRPAPTRRS